MAEFSAPLLRLDSCEPIKRRLDRNRSLLLRALDGGNVIAFLGSGFSAAHGYPDWKGLALGILKRTSAALEGREPKPPELKEVNLYKEAVQRAVDAEEAGKETRESLDANALMFLIGACRAALERNKLRKVYEESYREILTGKSGCSPDPFKPLLKLPIRRFATSNYDCELERALVRCEHMSPQDLGLGPKEPFEGIGEQACLCKASFTQGMDGIDRLVRFALADVPEGQKQVFHCHGRYDQPKTVIATEDDYQKWYLSRDGRAYLAFQQNIELLFGSNPLLFIGYGLRDEDLLRPLRQFMALNAKRRNERPIFALLAASSEEERYHLAALSERFGLNVCQFECNGCHGNQLTVALHDELERLWVQLETMRSHVSDKPKMRPIQALKEGCCHCEILSTTPMLSVPLLPELEEAVSRHGVVVVVGPTGCGKSHQMLELVHTAEGRGFEKAFYWNTHYATEAITVVDAILDHFDPRKEAAGSRYERIGHCLRNHRFLLVLDGCERLLHWNGTAGEGVSYSATFRRFLQEAADPKSKSIVVIAGRLRPADLDEIEPRGPVRILDAQRVSAQNLCHTIQNLCPTSRPKEEEEERSRSALCSLLQGHAYGLHLAAEYLKLEIEALGLLNRQLAGSLRDDRLHAMFELLIDGMDRDEKRGNHLVKPFLNRLGLFLGPISADTLKLCFKQACKEMDRDDKDCRRNFCKIFRWLIKAGLLIRLKRPDEKGKRYTYSVHTTVRSALLSPRGELAIDPLPSFGLSGFTSGRHGVDPGPASANQVRSLFDQIVDQATCCLNEAEVARCPPEPDIAKAMREEAAARELCRAAFNLIRSRMEANTAPRWGSYEDYLQYGLRLEEAVQRAMGSEVWTYCDYSDARRFAEAKDSPLYPAELAWLYNDLALAYSTEGHVTEACDLWEKTYEVSRLIEDSTIGGSYHLEVLLSLAMTSIERGRLPSAAHYVDSAERILLRFDDRDYTARICGLRGLMAHVQGNLQEADDLYERALLLLRPGNNLRAQSVFLKHRADLKVVTGQYEEADMLIRNSRTLAESGVFPELVAYARISEGHRLMRRGQPVPARLEYTAVLHEARRIGFHKLEVAALTALARLALSQEDPEDARGFALQASSLANELGLGLRQTHSLVVLGLATLETGQTDLGIACLRLAKRRADRQEYWSRSREAENKLREFGVNLEEEADGG